MSEMLTSRIYRNLGRVEPVRPGLRRSESGRVHLLGEGLLGGKGEGTLVLDHARHKGMVSGYSVPRSLVLCESFSANPRRNEVLFETLRELGFHRALAIRSSSPFEDQLGQTAAGIFATEFHALPLDTDESRAQFAAKLTAVYESANSERARAYLQRRCLVNHPLSVVIQEVVGSEWQYAPQYFMPAIAGITNTSLRKSVRTAAVLGLGLSAVKDEGLGRLYRLPILQNDPMRVSHNRNGYTGDFNSRDVSCLDLTSGQVTRLQNEASVRLFPDDYLYCDLERQFSEIPVTLSRIALMFERLCEFPVDIEWASQNGKWDDLSLLQIRPISKRPEIARPKVMPENVLFESKNLLGYGEKSFDYVIFVMNFISSPFLKKMVEKFPRSLIVYQPRRLDVRTTPLESESMLTCTDACVFIDPNPSEHFPGTGMQHLALNLADENKIVVLVGPEATKAIRSKGKLLEDSCSLFGNMAFIYSFGSPIHLAADDDAGWAMVWVE